ncbi:MAG: hypothetical protein SNH73_06040 [Rikenellaceae bacterium]
MKQEENQFLIEYEERLTKRLLQQFTDAGFLNGELLAVEELEEKWDMSAAEYMAAAVPQINDYPAAAVAWAAYMGVGLSILWDTRWEEYSSKEDLYTVLATPRGFDEMDEYVLEEMLGYTLEGEEATKIEDLFRAGATTALTMIRKESIEAQSVMAFYIFARSAKVFFRLGVAVGLRILGYSYQRQCGQKWLVESP